MESAPYYIKKKAINILKTIEIKKVHMEANRASNHSIRKENQI
jgi:hypothetical protein